jgi:lipoate synthase
MDFDNAPDGRWYDTYLGSGDIMYVPLWLEREIAEYLDVPELSTIPTNLWFMHKLEHDIAIGLATDISNQKEFEILASILSDTIGLKGDWDDEGYRLFQAADDAAEKYARWVRKTYFQARRKFNEQRDICILCEISKRLSTSDVCAGCRLEYAHEEQRIKAHLYRARKAGTPATLTLGQWVKTIKRYHDLCAYCTTQPYEVLEHYIPIAAGGGTTQENCVPACRSCNISKHVDHPEKVR